MYEDELSQEPDPSIDETNQEVNLEQGRFALKEKDKKRQIKILNLLYSGAHNEGVRLLLDYYQKDLNASVKGAGSGFSLIFNQEDRDTAIHDAIIELIEYIQKNPDEEISFLYSLLRCRVRHKLLNRNKMLRRFFKLFNLIGEDDYSYYQSNLPNPDEPEYKKLFEDRTFAPAKGFYGMTERERRILHLHSDGYKFGEIGNMMNPPEKEGTVRMVYHRTIRKLKEQNGD